MSDPILIPIIGGAVLSLLTLLFLIAAFITRKHLLPEERGKCSLLTIFPFSVRCDGFVYAGPFSRFTLYPDMLVVKALGVSCAISRSELVGSPRLHGAWVVILAKVTGQEREVRVATDNNTGLRDRLCAWLEGKSVS